MAYTPNTWIDRVTLGGNRFTDQNGVTYEFSAAPEQVVNEGTPFSAAWMNHLEMGVASAMPTSGGQFTGATQCMPAPDDNAPQLRNVVIVPAGTDVSTLSVPVGTIIMVRK